MGAPIDTPNPVSTSQVTKTPPTLVNGFTISDDLKSAYKDFTCGVHKLRLTIPLPSDKSQFNRITENYNNKLDRMGDAALAAGLGKKATAIGFDEDAQGQLVGVHRYKGKKVTVLNQEYFQKETNKSKLEKNNKLFESVKNIFERKDVPPSTGDTPKTAQTPPKATDDQTDKKDELEAKPKKKTQANIEADKKEDVKTEDKKEEVEEAKSKKAKSKEAAEKKEDVKPEDRFKELNDDESTSEEELYKG